MKHLLDEINHWDTKEKKENIIKKAIYHAACVTAMLVAGVMNGCPKAKGDTTDKYYSSHTSYDPEAEYRDCDLRSDLFLPQEP